MYYVLCDSEKPLQIFFDEWEAKASWSGGYYSQRFLEVFNEEGIKVKSFMWVWEKTDFSEGYWTEDF